jgi:hypothetical protein
VPPDAATPERDASQPAPAAAQPEPDAGPEPSGLSWPDSQVFPSFAPVGELDVIRAPNRPGDILTMLTTLQRIVNRTRPRIFVHEGSAGDDLWLAELGVATTQADDPLALVTKYASELRGLVIYDDAMAETINLATTMAGIEDVLAVSPALASTLSAPPFAPPFALPVIADLRQHHFTTKLQVYD